MSIRPLRILHLVNDITGKGNGIVNAAIDIAWGQSRQGHSVAVASAGGEYEALLAEHRIHHFALDQTRRPMNLLHAAARFRGIVQEFEPDIVHCHMMTGMLLAWACRGSGDYRLVSHIQNVHQRSSVLMRLGERIIPVAGAVADYMAQHGVPRERMRVVGNFTLGTPRLPALSAVEPAPLHQPAIVTAAGMYQRKGIRELIQAFAEVAKEHPDAHLYLVGDGPDRARFEVQAAALDCSDRIHFEGFQRNPQRYMKAATVFVLASHRESFGIVLVEAREAGCAIVATDVDGIPEALDQGKAGLLVPPGDAGALKQAISHLLANPAVRRQWQQAAQHGLERLTAEEMSRQVTNVYLELLEEPPAAPSAVAAGSAGEHAT